MFIRRTLSLVQAILWLWPSSPLAKFEALMEAYQQGRVGTSKPSRFGVRRAGVRPRPSHNSDSAQQPRALYEALPDRLGPRTESFSFPLGHRFTFQGLHHDLAKRCHSEAYRYACTWLTVE